MLRLDKLSKIELHIILHSLRGWLSQPLFPFVQLRMRSGLYKRTSQLPLGRSDMNNGLATPLRIVYTKLLRIPSWWGQPNCFEEFLLRGHLHRINVMSVNLHRRRELLMPQD